MKCYDFPPSGTVSYGGFWCFSLKHKMGRGCKILGGKGITIISTYTYVHVHTCIHICCKSMKGKKPIIKYKNKKFKNSKKINININFLK